MKRHPFKLFESPRVRPWRCATLLLWVGKFNLLGRNLQAPACVKSDFSGYPFLVAKTNKPFELRLFDDPAHKRYSPRTVHEIADRRFDLTFKVTDQYVPEFLKRWKWNRGCFHRNPVSLTRQSDVFLDDRKLESENGQCQGIGIAQRYRISEFFPE